MVTQLFYIHSQYAVVVRTYKAEGKCGNNFDQLQILGAHRKFLMNFSSVTDFNCWLHLE